MWLTRLLVDLHTIVGDLVGRGVSVSEGQTYSAKVDPIASLMLGGSWVVSPRL